MENKTTVSQSGAYLLIAVFRRGVADLLCQYHIDRAQVRKTKVVSAPLASESVGKQIKPRLAIVAACVRK